MPVHATTPGSRIRSVKLTARPWSVLDANGNSWRPGRLSIRYLEVCGQWRPRREHAGPGAHHAADGARRHRSVRMDVRWCISRTTADTAISRSRRLTAPLHTRSHSSVTRLSASACRSGLRWVITSRSSSDASTGTRFSSSSQTAAACGAWWSRGLAHVGRVMDAGCTSSRAAIWGIGGLRKSLSQVDPRTSSCWMD